jgi:hypothetical protein
MIYLESNERQCVSRDSQNTSFHLTDLQTTLSTLEKIQQSPPVTEKFSQPLPTVEKMGIFESSLPIV